MVDAALPSSADGYDFLFSATVTWRPVPDHADQSDGGARRYLLEGNWAFRSRTAADG